MMVNKSQRNIAIMCIRIVAMLFIFTDHAIAYTDSPYKSVIIQITNSANLIFLYISGFLYGGKDVHNVKAWIQKRITRLWIPYIIFIFVYFSIRFIQGEGLNNVKPFVIYAFVMQGFLGTQGGPSTLWFMTLLILCYCLIPLLQKARDEMSVISNGQYFVFGAVALVVLVQLFLAYHCTITLDFGHPLSWYIVALFVFCCGYYSNRKTVLRGISKKEIAGWTIVMCIAMAIRIVGQRTLDGTILYNKVISIWTNFILDIWIVYFIYYVVNKVRRFFDCELVRQGDKISYAFYLVHATTLEICFMMKLNALLSIAIAFTLSVVFAYMLYFVSNKFISVITNNAPG